MPDEKGTISNSKDSKMAAIIYYKGLTGDSPCKTMQLSLSLPTCKQGCS